MAGRPRTFVFVIGCQRSGTTLLGQVLGAHPNAVLLDETDGVYYWFKKALRSPGTEPPLPQKVLDAARSKYSSPDGRFIQNAIGEIELGDDVTHVILKVPNLTYAYDDVARLDASTRIVSPIRDPRAVVASMAKLAHIPMVENQVSFIRTYDRLVAELADDLGILESPDADMAIKRAVVWRIKNSLYDRFVENGETSYRLRYEDFVGAKERYSAELAKHVGLEFDDRMTLHEGEYVGIGPGFTDRRRAVDEVSVDAWKGHLEPEMAAQVLSTAGPLAAEFGYR